MPRTSITGMARRETTSHRLASSTPPRRRSRGKRAWRQTQLPSSSWTALCRMPRRNEDSERVGLYSTVRARMSSKLAKVGGPSRKAMMGEAFLSLTPGVTSIRASRGTRSG